MLIAQPTPASQLVATSLPAIDWHPNTRLHDSELQAAWTATVLQQAARDLGRITTFTPVDAAAAEFTDGIADNVRAAYEQFRAVVSSRAQVTALSQAIAGIASLATAENSSRLWFDSATLSDDLLAASVVAASRTSRASLDFTP